MPAVPLPPGFHGGSASANTKQADRGSVRWVRSSELTTLRQGLEDRALKTAVTLCRGLADAPGVTPGVASRHRP